MTWVICTFFLLLFVVSKWSRIQLLPGACCTCSRTCTSCPALAPSSPSCPQAVGPLGSPAPWLVPFSYQCLWDLRKDYVSSSHLCPTHQGHPSSKQGLQREKEDSAFASPGDSRAVGEGRESCGIESGEQILAEGERLGQVNSWHRPLTRHCGTGHTPILYSSLRPHYSAPLDKGMGAWSPQSRTSELVSQYWVSEAADAETILHRHAETHTQVCKHTQGNFPAANMHCLVLSFFILSVYSFSTHGCYTQLITMVYLLSQAF